MRENRYLILQSELLGILQPDKPNFGFWVQFGNKIWWEPCRGRWVGDRAGGRRRRTGWIGRLNLSERRVPRQDKGQIIRAHGRWDGGRDCRAVASSFVRFAWKLPPEKWSPLHKELKSPDLHIIDPVKDETTVSPTFVKQDTHYPEYPQEPSDRPCVESCMEHDKSSGRIA